MRKKQFQSNTSAKHLVGYVCISEQWRMRRQTWLWIQRRLGAVFICRWLFSSMQIEDRNFLFFRGWTVFPAHDTASVFFSSVLEMLFTLLLIVWNVLFNSDFHCLFLPFCSFNCSSLYFPLPFTTCLFFSCTVIIQPFFVAHCSAKKDNILLVPRKKERKRKACSREAQHKRANRTQHNSAAYVPEVL